MNKPDTLCGYLIKPVNKPQAQKYLHPKTGHLQKLQSRYFPWIWETEGQEEDRRRLSLHLFSIVLEG